MNDSQVSVTALISAVFRAFHSTHDAPKIFDDFLAAKLFAPEELAGFERNLAEALAVFDPEATADRPDPRTALARFMRGQSTPGVVISRARYAEHLLETELERGTRQYVILGAGLDTLAFRRPELLRTLHVYELDHPATQADKLRRIARAGWSLPERLRFLPVDLSRETAESALRRSDFDPRVPTFFSWLGVTYYLPRDKVFDTLRSLASFSCPGSLVVFDFVDTDTYDPRKASPRLQRVQAVARRVGEPMQSGFDPATLAAELKSVGLTLQEHLSPERIQERFFADRTDGYRAVEHFHFAAARVG